VNRHLRRAAAKLNGKAHPTGIRGRPLTELEGRQGVRRRLWLQWEEGKIQLDFKERSGEATDLDRWDVAFIEGVFWGNEYRIRELEQEEQDRG
jgi:hypothetical protein